MPEKNMICISADEFSDLLKAKAQLELLVGILADTATLNYNKTGLSFDDDLLFALLCNIDEWTVENKLDKLLAKARNSDSTTIKV